MSNVLLVDTNFSSLPIYEYLISCGHNVWVVGGNPDDALAKSSSKYVQFDYSDIDKLEAFISNEKIDFIVPGCNDKSYMVCAEVSHGGRFPGVDSLKTSSIINNKKKFREYAAQIGLSVPRVLAKDEIGACWPIIVKPVDAFSGRGVTVIQECDNDGLSDAMDKARAFSIEGTCIVEEYVDGQLYSHSAFINNKSIVKDFIVEEHGTANQFVVDTSRLVDNFPLHLIDKIRKDIEILAEKLKLQDGLVHTQFICNGDQYWLIEITRRCPGDLYSQLIELSCGFNYVENYVRPFLGQRNALNDICSRKWIVRHTISQESEIFLGSIEFTMQLKVKKWIPLALTGDRLMASPSGRVGILFAEAGTEEDSKSIFESALSRMLYKIIK